MNVIYLQLLTIALLVAIACAQLGTFLILRGVSLISDALSQAILLGIVITFLITKNLSSPFSFLGAIAAAMITIAIIELIIKSKRLEPDAVIAVIFPMLFSIAIIIINQYASTIHIDIDAVILGELSLAPFHKLIVHGQDYGPICIWLMSIIVSLNACALFIFYRALKFCTFDSDFAILLGYKPHVIYYVLMMLTSITILGSFESAGAILIIAFMIIPPATAHLITYDLKHMLIISNMIAIIAVISGCILANLSNSSIAASIATMNGAIFAFTLYLKQKYPNLFS